MTEASKSRSLETIKTVKIVRVMAADQQQPATEKMLDNSHEIFEDHANKEARIPSRTSGDGVIGPQDCTEMDVKTFHVTLTYKPRI